MTKKAFKESIRRGLGSAIICLDRCSNKDVYKDIVLWACLNNTCYDMQVEGDRTQYLYSAICKYDDVSFFEQYIISKYSKNTWHVWLFEQITGLLCQFAKNGSEQAKKALYNKYEKLFQILSSKRSMGSYCYERDQFEWLCVWLTSLDGFSAFKRIVADVGAHFAKDKCKDSFNMDWFYSNAQSKFGKKRVLKFLNSNSSDTVKAFCDEVEEYEKRFDSPLPPLPTCEEIISACREDPDTRSRGLSVRLARRGSKEEQLLLAEAAVSEQDLSIKAKLLWAFRSTPFPLNADLIFAYADSDYQELRDVALEILPLLKSDRVHDYAVSLINSGSDLCQGISILCNNFLKSDSVLLSAAIKKVSLKDYGWHWAFSDVQKLIDRNHYAPKELLPYMYEKSLCSFCREYIVRTMGKRKILSEEILEECLFDSNSDVRKFADHKGN